MKKHAKGKHRKRETNADRALRELCRRGDLNKAERVAYMITRRKKGLEEEVTPQDEEAWIRLGVQIHGCSPDFLRLLADMLEGKRPYSRGDDWFDDKIKAAYSEAWEAHGTRPVDFTEFMTAYSEGRPVSHLMSDESDIPSFSEFMDVFRKKNPQLQRVSKRSLRRSLWRLGYTTREGKPGRPKGK